MPIFHFHCANGTREPDLEGTELPDEASARLVGMQYAGEVLKTEPDRIWADGAWRVEVTDDDNVLLFTIITIAVDAPKRDHVLG